MIPTIWILLKWVYGKGYGQVESWRVLGYHVSGGGDGALSHMVAHQIEVQETTSSNDFIHHCSWLCVCRIARLTIGKYSGRDFFLHNDESEPGCVFFRYPTECFLSEELLFSSQLLFGHLQHHRGIRHCPWRNRSPEVIPIIHTKSCKCLSRGKNIN